MALITCTECGKQISDRATKCPQCGCPVSSQSQKPITNIQENQIGSVVYNGEQQNTTIEKDVSLVSLDINILSGEELFKLGNKEKQKGNYSVAIKYYENAAEKKNIGAIRELVNIYLNGFGVQANQELAFTYCKKGAMLSDAECECMLSEMYGNGVGVNEDYDRAISYAKAAAAHGNRRAKEILSIENKNNILMIIQKICVVLLGCMAIGFLMLFFYLILE